MRPSNDRRRQPRPLLPFIRDFPRHRQLLRPYASIQSSPVQHGTAHELLEDWQKGRFILLISPDQVVEIRTVLSRPQIAELYGITQAEQTEFVRLLKVAATLVRPVAKLPLPVRDPKDDMILATALGGEADYLVTGDDDLLVLAGDIRLGALKVVNPRHFLALLSDPRSQT